jgi:CheY-like chemotaxis protein
MDPGLMGARILIVDDEEIVIKSCLRILGGGNYHVEAAYNGREALRKIEENHYDVMILDVMMPNIGALKCCAGSKRRIPTWT